MGRASARRAGRRLLRGLTLEIWFYHLLKRRLDQALPALIERTLARGWRAVVQARTPERLQAIDDFLWTYSEDSFLAHGGAADGDAELQPVWLTLGPDAPNGAQIRFLVEGADPASFLGAGFERLILLFEERDAEAVAQARENWRALKQAGATLAYWRETEEGGWVRQA